MTYYYEDTQKILDGFSEEDIMLNRKRTAEQINRVPAQHAQETWFQPKLPTMLDTTLKDLFKCDTKACVAGWAVLITLPLDTRLNTIGSWSYAGARILGLNVHNMHHMFYGLSDEHARKAINYLADENPTQDQLTEYLEEVSTWE